MLDQQQGTTRINSWDRLVRERVGEPLRPERLRSLLVVVPAASGDVALATTMVRHVKRVNPECRVSFATERPNIPIAKMCPGVDETIEMAYQRREDLSRRRSLRDYAGRADAVVYTNWWPEDVDLAPAHHLTMLEAVWLLTGLTGGMPPTPQKVWLESPLGHEGASAVVRRCLSGLAGVSPASWGVRRTRESLVRMVRTRSLRGSGIVQTGRGVYRLSRQKAEARKQTHREGFSGAALKNDFVILCTEARSVPPPPLGFTQTLVRVLRQAGRVVLQNVLDPAAAAPGAVPLVCSYEEFVGLRQSGVPFVGWRSGLCDIAAASHAPMVVFYPRENFPAERVWCEDLSVTFGFNAMNVDADCLDIVCHSVEDLALRRSDILNHLQQGTRE